MKIDKDLNSVMRGGRLALKAQEKVVIPYGIRFAWCFLLAVLLFIGGCWGSVAHAQEYTDEQIVNAIYIAEGGKNAKYPYGIRSVSCSGEKHCRRICANTVRNNRIRYQRSKSKGTMDFIAYLGSRYCPTDSPRLSRAEKNLNKNWQKNVRAILAKGHKEA